VIAGAITGVVGVFIPQVLGVGYETIDSAYLEIKKICSRAESRTTDD
jgi:hypothetical protein